MCACTHTYIKKKYGLFPWPYPTFHEKKCSPRSCSHSRLSVCHLSKQFEIY